MINTSDELKRTKKRKNTSKITEEKQKIGQMYLEKNRKTSDESRR